MPAAPTRSETIVVGPNVESPLIALFFLCGSFFLTLAHASLLKLGKLRSNALFRSASPPHLWIKQWLKALFTRHEWDLLYFFLSISKQIYQLSYAVSLFFYLLQLRESLIQETYLSWSLVGAITISLALSVDYLARLFAMLFPKRSCRISSPIASLYVLPLFPLLLLLQSLTRTFSKKVQTEESLLPQKREIKELLHESEIASHLNLLDQKLIASCIHFTERVTKEIMVPRVQIFSLPSDTTLREAAPLFAKEGYSRIPIYQEHLDDILGVVLYKDLLLYLAQEHPPWDLSLAKLAKPVVYAPENKKIATLLQEFRLQQIHMAIIVDEYGGTEGIVTIEDILEELVGEIEDEYDRGSKESFWEIPGGGWVVDAKMTIHDIEEKLGIQIPDHPEYETLGGFIYHCAGTIPSKGWRLSHDRFDLEVLSSNERAVLRVKIQQH